MSILMPVDLRRRTGSLVNRIAKLAEISGPTGLNIVVGHADRNTPWDRLFKRIMRRHSHVEVISQPVDSQHPNLARLRNIAAHKANDGVLVFLDADIAPDVDLFLALAKQVLEGNAIAMAPCLYLSSHGTVQLESGIAPSVIVNSALRFSSSVFTHWALPSSVMAMLREDFLDSGGFHEDYTGHGYEDFDFMIRFAIENKLLIPSLDLLIDQPYRAPLLAEGFRGALGVLCLPNLLQGNIAVHQFHHKDNEEAYYKQRGINAKLFRERISDILAKQCEDLPYPAMPPMIPVFFDECKKQGVPPSEYYALFDARPRHLLISRSRLKRVVSHSINSLKEMISLFFCAAREFRD